MSERLNLPELPAAVDAYEIVQSCRLAFLRRLAQALREAGAPPEGVETACLGAGRFFDESVAARRAGFEQADGLTASKISLVCDDQLELEIALGDLARRLSETAAAPLRRLFLRMASLLRRPNLAPADLPLAPEALAQGIGEMLAAQGGGMAQWQTLLERSEEALGKHLPALYGELDEALARQGVEPAQLLAQATGSGAAAARESRPAATPGVAPTPETGNPAAALQAALLARAAAPVAASGAPTTVVPVELLARLMSRLDALERIEGAETPGRLTTALRTGELDGGELAAAGLPQTATLDALALVFEAIFADPDLPDAVKSAIASLQIPILKTAIATPGFFGEAGHPARRLLDRMAAAAVGLPRDASPDEPVCERLQEMAAYVRSEFDGSPGIFESSIAKVDAIVARRDHEAGELAATYRPLAEAWNLKRAGARRAREALAALVSGAVPAPIADFLRGPWSRHLESLGGELGEASREVSAALQLARDLIWSVEPKEAPEERRRLAQGVPVLLKGINEGLDRLGVSAEERAPFLDACFALQTAAIRATPGVPAAAPPADGSFAAPRALAPEAPQPSLEMVSGEGLRLKVLDLPGRVPGSALLASPPWQPGDWIELRLPAGEAVLAHLGGAALDGWPLFVNPAWDHALLVSPLILDRQLRQGEALRRSGHSLFDAAAAQVLEQTVV